jgi:hypothetical protein
MTLTKTKLEQLAQNIIAAKRTLAKAGPYPAPRQGWPAGCPRGGMIPWRDLDDLFAAIDALVDA